LAAWIHFGGGHELWDELSANYNIKPLLCLNTGVQMGGWFTKEVTGPESYVGLKYRMPGLGGEVLRRLGAVVVVLGGGEIVPALRSGAIDASEWVGPWNDMQLGLHKVSKFYYYPGFHEPDTGVTIGINKSLWDSLPAEDRNVITTGWQRPNTPFRWPSSTLTMQNSCRSSARTRTSKSENSTIRFSRRWVRPAAR
jgi:TRAP-type mannitol/chloroaromatic compound transport system substrate-binding protein